MNEDAILKGGVIALILLITLQGILQEPSFSPTGQVASSSIEFVDFQLESSNVEQSLPLCDAKTITYKFETNEILSNDETCRPDPKTCFLNNQKPEEKQKCFDCCNKGGTLWGPNWKAACQIYCRQEPLPPAPGGPGSCTENYESCMASNPLIAQIIDAMQAKGCTIPKIRCSHDSTKCRTPERRGFYCCTQNEMHLCGKEEGTCEIIQHELIHAYDICMDPKKCNPGSGSGPVYPGEKNCGGPNNCEEAACAEARAYAYDGPYCSNGKLDYMYLASRLWLSLQRACPNLTRERIIEIVKECAPADACSPERVLA